MKNRRSRISGILIFLLFISLTAYSQRKSDIGLFGGTSYYMGDLNPSRHFHLPGYGYAYGPFFRYNFEPRNSIRLSGIYHNLKGDSELFGKTYNDPFVQSLNENFTETFIDVAANYEFNFIPYKTANRKLKKSLYLSAGLGYHILLTSSNEDTKSHFIIPFGIGYKLNVTKKMSIGAEVSVRKTFSDTAIDGIHNIGGGDFNLVGNNDWYTFAGIFISYKIFNYREDCPAYD